MPIKSRQKQKPKTDDEIIKYVMANNLVFRKSDSDIERKILEAELRVKYDEDIRYFKAVSAIVVAGNFKSAHGKTKPLKFEEIKEAYILMDKHIPEKYKNRMQDYYADLALWFGKQTEIKKGVFNAYT